MGWVSEPSLTRSTAMDTCLRLETWGWNRCWGKERHNMAFSFYFVAFYFLLTLTGRTFAACRDYRVEMNALLCVCSY